MTLGAKLSSGGDTKTRVALTFRFDICHTPNSHPLCESKMEGPNEVDTTPGDVSRTRSLIAGLTCRNYEL